MAHNADAGWLIQRVMMAKRHRALLLTTTMTTNASWSWRTWDYPYVSRDRGICSVNPYQEGKTSRNHEDKTDNHEYREQVIFRSPGHNVNSFAITIYIYKKVTTDPLFDKLSSPNKLAFNYSLSIAYQAEINKRIASPSVQ